MDKTTKSFVIAACSVVILAGVWQVVGPLITSTNHEAQIQRCMRAAFDSGYTGGDTVFNIDDPDLRRNCETGFYRDKVNY